MPRLTPPNLQDPIGLSLRLARSHERAAYFAVGSILLAALATPLDMLLEVAERRRYRRAGAPRRPIVFVTGPPRSGTTLVAQSVAYNLPVTYFNNLTAVFPRAPIVANRLLGRFVRRPRAVYESFYGRTSGFGSPADGLQLWDRWMGPDRYIVPTGFDTETATDMRRFFAAYETAFGRPLLNKNNALATCASLVARTLPTSHFIYVRRDPPFAVQSILIARALIQGSRARPYGVGDPSWSGGGSPIEEVCAQVLHHERRMMEQQRELGERRFWIVEYEAFCREPDVFVARVAEELLDVTVDRAALQRALPPFRVTNRPGPEFDEIMAALQGRSAFTGTGRRARSRGSASAE